MTTPAPLVWIDLEMSGLDPDRCKILEIATLVTDADLEIVAEGPDIVVHQPDAVLDAMDEWCTTHHGESGLTAAVKASNVSLEQAEAQTLAFLEPLTEAGLVLSGLSPDGRLVEMVELPKDRHPFFVGCQFHPEFRSRPTLPHPLFAAFIGAAVDRIRKTS